MSSKIKKSLNLGHCVDPSQMNSEQHELYNKMYASLEENKMEKNLNIFKTYGEFYIISFNNMKTIVEKIKEKILKTHCETFPPTINETEIDDALKIKRCLCDIRERQVPFDICIHPENIREENSCSFAFYINKTKNLFEKKYIGKCIISENRLAVLSKENKGFF